MNVAEGLRTALASCPAVAILRGVEPKDCIPVAESLVEAGFRVLEIPLNSPDACASIARLRAHFPAHIVVGAGTVLTSADVAAVAAAGAQICLAPNCDPRVIRHCIEAGIVPIPGVATSTEAFQAIDAGARWLKLYPADSLGTSFIKALKAVVPADLKLLAVGGVNAENAADLVAAGCIAVGVGSEIFRPKYSQAEVKARASRLVQSVKTRVRVAVASKASVGESPFWNQATGEVVWVDFGANAILRGDPRSGSLAAIPLDSTLSALMPTPDGRIVGVGASSVRQVDLQTGATTPLAEVVLPHENTRLNDAAIDPLGRIWSGSMSYGLLSGKGALFVSDLTGKSSCIADGFGVCNGLGWSADFRTLYLVDTLHRNLLAFDCDLEGGKVSRPRIVTDFQLVQGKPDGLAVDAEGGIWVAMWGGSRVVRVEQNGSISRQITMPARHVSSCCFAGDNYGTLYVTTSRFRLSEADLANAPDSGALFAIDLCA